MPVRPLVVAPRETLPFVFNLRLRELGVLGIDIGTSGVKAVRSTSTEPSVAQASGSPKSAVPPVSRTDRNPGGATVNAVHGLPAVPPIGVQAVGLSGQMHGATLLDAEDRPLRPASYGMDGRSSLECIDLEHREPSHAPSPATSYAALPRPKLLWIARHEPAIFRNTASVLLPKDIFDSIDRRENHRHVRCSAPAG